jgi:hypothetical protein
MCQFGLVISIWTKMFIRLSYGVIDQNGHYDCNEQSATAFFVSRLPTGGGENTAYSVHTTRLTFNVCLIKFYTTLTQRARGSLVGWGTMLQAGRSRDQVPMRWILCTITTDNLVKYRNPQNGAENNKYEKALH